MGSVEGLAVAIGLIVASENGMNMAYENRMIELAGNGSGPGRVPPGVP